MKKKTLLWLTAIFLCAVWVGCYAQPPEGAFPARIIRWHDGDTAQLRMTGDVPTGVAGYEVVRLLGVDTPEVGEPFADDATRFFRTLTMGKQVYVELNPHELRDRHSRLLAYLWVESDDGWVPVSEALLRAGLARVLVYYPERENYYCRFLHAHALAQGDKLGLWGAFPDPIMLEEIEARPVMHVTEVVTVVFTVSRVGWDRWGLSLWADGSRYGFRAIFDTATCPGSWDDVCLPTEVWVGRTVAATGELLWDSHGGGPRVVVRFPELVVMWPEEGDGT